MEFCRSISSKLKVEIEKFEWTPEWNNCTKSQGFLTFRMIIVSPVYQKDVSSSPLSNPEAEKITEADDSK